MPVAHITPYCGTESPIHDPTCVPPAAPGTTQRILCPSLHPAVSFGSVVAPARGSPTAQETDTATSAPYAQAQAQASAPTLRLSPLTLVRSLQQACSPRPGLAK